MANPPKKGSPAMCARRPASCLGYNPDDNDSEDEAIGLAAFVLEVENKAREWKCQSCHRSDVSAHPGDNGHSCRYCWAQWRLHELASDTDVPNLTRHT
eukprot:15473991-Alexandrium_andersonii.AAC.1